MDASTGLESAQFTPWFSSSAGPLTELPLPYSARNFYEICRTSAYLSLLSVSLKLDIRFATIVDVEDSCMELSYSSQVKIGEKDGMKLSWKQGFPSLSTVYYLPLEC